MVRTTLSLCALFGCIISLSHFVNQTQAPPAAPLDFSSPTKPREQDDRELATPPGRLHQAGLQGHQGPVVALQNPVCEESGCEILAGKASHPEMYPASNGPTLAAFAAEEPEPTVADSGAEESPADAPPEPVPAQTTESPEVPRNPIRDKSATEIEGPNLRNFEPDSTLIETENSAESLAEIEAKAKLDAEKSPETPAVTPQPVPAKPQSTPAPKSPTKLEPTPARKPSEPTPAKKPATATAPEMPAKGATPKEAPSDTVLPIEPNKLPVEITRENSALTPEMQALHEKIQLCLAHYIRQPENVATRSPWGCMHGMIAYGVDADLIANNRQVNAIGWLCFNGVCNGQSLFYTDRGELKARIGPGVQGHAGQFLSMLAQSRVQPEYPIRVDGYSFSVADLIEHEKQSCKPRTELTFKLIALTHYLKSDERWRSQDGQEWDIPRLIREELAQPIVGAACGGTHRLTGFSYAVRKRQLRGEPMEGQWLRAQVFLQDFHKYAFQLQNQDGSASTDWFKGRADNGPPSRRLETTGHTTEWLAFSLSETELTQPQMVKSVDYLATLLLAGKNEKWSIGPLGHGLHALALYDERVFGSSPGKRKEELAKVWAETQLK